MPDERILQLASADTTISEEKSGHTVIHYALIGAILVIGATCTAYKKCDKSQRATKKEQIEERLLQD